MTMSAKSIEATRPPGAARADTPSATTGVRPEPGGVQRVELAIDSLNCPHCAQTVEQVLRGVHGVRAVTVNPTSGVAFVDYEPSQTPVAGFYEALKAAGYRSDSA